MLPFSDKIYTAIAPGRELIFVADIGGTNSNFGLCSVENGIAQLHYALHIKSHYIQDIIQTLGEVIEHINARFSLNVTRGCIAAAGLVTQKNSFCKLTNLNISIDANKVLESTTLKELRLINDFIAVGYGIESLEPQDIVQVLPGAPELHLNRAIIGAGTGLGKTMLLWSHTWKRYVSLASEGGHADFAAQYEQELSLVEFIRKQLGGSGTVSWEHVLSGSGIVTIYNFLGTIKSYQRSSHAQKILKTEQELHPDQIFALKADDPQCKETYELYIRFYARCAKNTALEALALNGLYIAGGIAAKNITMFSHLIFAQEFLDNHKQRSILEKVPVYVITNYEVSLYGAAVYFLCIKIFNVSNQRSIILLL